jgi:hypothetical protein
LLFQNRLIGFFLYGWEIRHLFGQRKDVALIDLMGGFIVGSVFLTVDIYADFVGFLIDGWVDDFFNCVTE